MSLTYRKTKTPGKCPVRYCRNLPRNIGDHPSSCQLCGSHHKELWRVRHPEHAAYDTLRASARKRGIVFTLTLTHFKATIAPTAYLTESGSTRYCLHIDRKDNTFGYIDGNIQLMTCTENVAKGNAERRQKFVDEKVRGYATPEPDPF
jgi:hypothetical protein